MWIKRRGFFYPSLRHQELFKKQWISNRSEYFLEWQKFSFDWMKHAGSERGNCEVGDMWDYTRGIETSRVVEDTVLFQGDPYKSNKDYEYL